MKHGKFISVTLSHQSPNQKTSRPAPTIPDCWSWNSHRVRTLSRRLEQLQSSTGNHRKQKNLYIYCPTSHLHTKHRPSETLKWQYLNNNRQTRPTRNCSFLLQGFSKRLIISTWTQTSWASQTKSPGQRNMGQILFRRIHGTTWTNKNLGLYYRRWI